MRHYIYWHWLACALNRQFNSCRGRIKGGYRHYSAMKRRKEALMKTSGLGTAKEVPSGATCFFTHSCQISHNALALGVGGDLQRLRPAPLWWHSVTDARVIDRIENEDIRGSWYSEQPVKGGTDESLWEDPAYVLHHGTNSPMKWGKYG